ncbi:MAG: FecR domain-containing protein [Burkholderiaceae bacterium]
MKRTLLQVVTCALVFFGHTAMAADEAGTVKISRGSVTLERGGQQLSVPIGTRIFASDRIVTGADGSVGITLRDNTLLSAGPSSTVDLNKFAFNSTTHAGTIDASVKRGTLSVVSGKIAKATPDAVSFSAPGMTLGVRGTSFIIDAGQ